MPASRGDPQVIQDLRSLLATDLRFRQEFESALSERDDLSGDPWRRFSLDDALAFFREWSGFIPLLHDERRYIDVFRQFYRTEKGKLLVRGQPFSTWLREFVLDRGRFLDSPESASGLDAWMKAPEVRIADFEVPSRGFTSFNDFFTRRLRPGVRPIGAPMDPATAVSPVDGKVEGVVALDETAKIDVKGMSLSAEDLLAGSSYAVRFAGGTALLLSLEPRHYHHFHAPLAGVLLTCKRVDGLYFGTSGFRGFFAEHPRGFVIVDVGAVGVIGMVSVGIADISSIQYSCRANEAVSKGQHLGSFAYGGSAIVLMFVKGAAQFQIQPGAALDMGQPIATIQGA